MVRVETHLGAAGTLPTLDPQLEGLVAAYAEFVFALKTIRKYIKLTLALKKYSQIQRWTKELEGRGKGETQRTFALKLVNKNVIKVLNIKMGSLSSKF